MDTNTAIVIVAAIVAFIVIFGYIRFKGRGKTIVTLPFGASIEQDGSNKQDSGDITGEKLTSTSGGITATTDGGNIILKNSKAKKDINMNSSNSQQQPPK
jgi:hypothetical protein